MREPTPPLIATRATAGRMPLASTPTRLATTHAKALSTNASMATASSRRSVKSLLSDVPVVPPLLSVVLTPTATPASDDKENRVTPNQVTASNTPTRVAPRRTPERIYESVLDAHGNVTMCSYLKGRFLGKGGFASVYEVVCERSSRKYACKLVTKRSLAKPKAKAKFKSEIKIHKALRHPNVVQFERYFEDDENAYILLELCRNQSLSDLLRRRKRLTEAEVRFYIRQLVDGLAYLHKNLVIHRDLKLGNLFISSEMKLKIGDFGLAALLDNEFDRKRTLCGTPNYIAPEILTGRTTTGHSFEVDIWSMGVVMYTLLVGKPPFETEDVKETYKRIRVGEYSFPPEIEISESAKSLVRSILRVEPHLRPSLNAILAHPFFSERPTMSSLPRSALLATPPECKRAIASNKRTMDARSYEQPPRYPLRRRDVNSARDFEHATPGTGPSTVIVQPTKYTLTSPVANDAEIQTTMVLGKSTNSSNASAERSPNSKRSLSLKKSTGFNASRATTATSDTPVLTAHGEDDDIETTSNAKDPFHVVQETLTHFFTLEESAQNEQTLDEFSSAAAICAAAKQVKDIQVERAAAQSQPLVPAPIWLSQWVDYTSKYGMGYVLSDGSSGVYFNDSTKIVASSDGMTLEYVERVAEISVAPEPFVRCPADMYDPALKKKVTLLTHFKSYLIDEREKKPEIAAFEEDVKRLAHSSEQVKSCPTRMVYIKKWVKTKHAVLFFLSNHTFQFNFYDASKLILSSCGRVATYVDKDGKLDVYSTAIAILDREPGDLTKRLRYARDMFEQIARVNAAASQPSEPECEKA